MKVKTYLKCDSIFVVFFFQNFKINLVKIDKFKISNLDPKTKLNTKMAKTLRFGKKLGVYRMPLFAWKFEEFSSKEVNMTNFLAQPFIQY